MRERLAISAIVIASDLTLIECDRVVIRAAALGDLTEADAADRRRHLTAAAAHGHVLRISGEIVERARQAFPGGPIRTLDAIHLASALIARSAAPGFAMLSLDDRIRAAATKLGFVVQPE